MDILFLDSSPSSHHERFVELFSTLGSVHSVYLDLHQEPPALQFDLVVFADLDITVDYAMKFSAPKVGLSWAWDLQQTLRQGFAVEEKLKKSLDSVEILIVDCIQVERIAREFGVNESQIFRAPYGINLEKYPLRKTKNIGTGTLRLYTNRRWENIYRPRIILEMAQEMYNSGNLFELTLANDGTLREPLIKEYSSLFESGSCSWIGKISQNQNIYELEKADLYISVSSCDGSSLSLLESMAIGVPSLVTDNPENREWIQNDLSGYLFSGNSGLELADKVLSIDLNSCHQKNLVDLSRDKVAKEADWSTIRQRLIEKVLKILN